MNPSEHWTQLVNQTLLHRRCGLAEAWRLTAAVHPEAATLMSAFGRTRQSVQFFNSRIANEITPDKKQAGSQLAKFANEKMKSSGLPYGQAWNKACAEHPELAATISGNVVVQFANDTAKPDATDRARDHIRKMAAADFGGAKFLNMAGGVPVAGHQVKAIFRLPQTCSQDEFAAAFHGNGDTLAPVNPGKIFAALVEYVQKKKSLDYNAAITAAKAAYPGLWDMVEAISNEKI
jgi:hypothetical protein